MSDISSDAESDISAFAAWERTNNEKIPSERELSLLDMAAIDRVWGDADSSNDARSGSEESGSEVVRKMGNRKGVKIGGMGMGKLGGKREIPGSTADEESQSLRLKLSGLKGKRVEVIALLPIYVEIFTN